ncbi:hypothetical protein RSOL_170800 [Rhizoctonia solani AG-3 Rhs1AP]|uniref:Uncharacterized protein n=2 Tax=Rhizoctonia solani AG-3 TaxID=1086053 RepID=A0A074RQS8_9AGAM|nr:hypothetical protein RSOL_170800 [Rhizoctonia solani AG-3 Rhs1AP]KEP49421.1 hypothetical protein V565_100850 [Rhizoctonia solani 123E]
MFEFSGVANFFKLGNSLAKANSRVVQGEDAAVILGEIEKMLEGSKLMLDEMTELLAADSLKIYTIQYRRLLTDAQAMRGKLRKDAKRNTSNDEVSNKEQVSMDVSLLFGTVERYHTDLVTASSQANQQEEDRLFAGLDYDDAVSFKSLVQNSTESWASLASTRGTSLSSRSSIMSDSRSAVTSDTSSVATGEYICVANLRGNRSSTRSQGQPRYCREIVVYEDLDDRSQVIMMGRNPVLLTETDPGNMDVDISILEMARVGKEVLRTGNVNSLPWKCILHAGHGATWVDTLVHNVSMMGLGIRAPVKSYRFGEINSASNSVGG